MNRNPRRLTAIMDGVMAHASGGLWLPNEGALLLADIHLGYGWALRRRGQLGPLADGETEQRIAAVIDELQPRLTLLLGDIVHAANPGEAERAAIAATLRAIENRSELICLRGNHDREFDYCHLEETWKVGCVRAMHGDRTEGVVLEADEVLAIGHHHPAIAIEDASGARRKVPAFLVAGRVVVLPAFSPFAAGLNVWHTVPDEIARLAGPDAKPGVIAATGKQVAPLGPLARLRGPGEGAYAERFRPRRQR